MSNLSLERLKFDPSAVSEGPAVGSYLVSAGGIVITDTAGALDVYIANTSIAISASDLDIRDLTHVSDSVKIGNGTTFMAVDTSGYITANINGTVATTLSDGVDSLAINTDGSINVNITDDSIADGVADGGNPLKVGSHAYDQAAAWSAVTADDRANLASDMYRRILINDAPNVSAACAAVSVGLTEVLLGTAIAGRTRIIIQNASNQSIFVGPTGVLASSGLLVAKGATLSLELGESIDLYGISTVAAQDVRVMQLA